MTSTANQAVASNPAGLWHRGYKARHLDSPWLRYL